jgi:hypothetical protein
MSTVFPAVKEWYVINGLEMSTHGYSIESIANSVPDRKGDNVSSPVIHGDIFREKRLTPRNESLVVWITDAHPTTGAVASTEVARRQQFNANYETVMFYINKLNSELDIEKHMIDPSSGSVIVRNAKAELASGFVMDDHRDLNVAKFSLDLRFLDPRWYAATNTVKTITLGFGTSETLVLSTSDYGTAPINKMTIVFSCAPGQTLINPRLTNLGTFGQIGYSGTINAGESVTIDTENLTMVKGATNVISDLYRSGSRQDWMEIMPASGVQSFYFSTTAPSSGTATITYKKAYF